MPNTSRPADTHPVMTGACMRCGRYGVVRGEGVPALLWLCTACVRMTTPCPEGSHPYRPTTEPGTWVCVQCGQLLRSVPATAPVRAEAADG